MSVPTWLRSVSKAEYLFQTFQLNIRIGQMVANLPKKYSRSHGDYLIRVSHEALLHGQTANKIRVIDESSYQTRRQHLQEMRGCVDNVATVAYIFLETVRLHEGIPDAKRAKIYKWESEIGDLCFEINKMIVGIMRSDRRTVNMIRSETPGESR